MNYSGLRDKHLNVFCPYGLKDSSEVDKIIRLENNITKAFVNTLQSLAYDDLKVVYKKLFNVDINSEYSYKYYLQSAPDEEIIKSIKKENRILFAFCPEGKCSAYEGCDIKDIETIKKVIIEEINNNHSEYSKKEIEDELKFRIDEIIEAHDKGSIPDGWIIIQDSNKPIVAIAMENKRHDLDPFQLNNHLEKSLLLKNKKDKENRIVYRKYSDIVESLKKCRINKYLANSFIEYLIILGYINVDNFEDACNSDKDIRCSLALAFAEEILNKLEIGKVDKRSFDTRRIKVSYDYLHEINLCFRNDCVLLSLAFGPTQNSAKHMFENINSTRLQNIENSRQTFHLQYNRGKNIKNSYIEKWNIDEYVDYWKRNISELYLRTPKEAIELYEKFYNDGIVDKEKYLLIKEILHNKKNKINIVPEILVEPYWTYEELSKMELNEFVEELRKTINEYLSIFEII